MWFGYGRSELLPMPMRDLVRHAMCEYAAHYGFGEGEIVIEPTAPEQVLRDLVAELDRRNPAGAVLSRLQQAALSWGVDLDMVFDANSPRTQSLWRIMDVFEGAAGAQLIVPSREHLTGLGPSGTAVVQRLGRMPTTHIYYLDSAPTATTSLIEQTAGAAAADEQVLVVSRVGAIPAAARLDMISELTRRGWTELIESVDRISEALLEDAAASAPSGTGFGSRDGHGAVIRLLSTGSGLLIELQESPPHDAAPSHQLTSVCEHTYRFTDNGRTVTRCTVPTAYTSPAPERGRNGHE